MTNLTRRAIDAAPKFAFENNSTAYTGAERQADDCLTTTSCASPHLSQRGGVRIVFEEHGTIKD